MIIFVYKLLLRVLWCLVDERGWGVFFGYIRRVVVGYKFFFVLLLFLKVLDDIISLRVYFV